MGWTCRETGAQLQIYSLWPTGGPTFETEVTGMDGEFKRYHLRIVDLLEDAEELETKQAAFDDHDEWPFDHLAHLATPEECEVKVRFDPQQPLHRRLQYVEQNLWKVAAAVSG